MMDLKFKKLLLLAMRMFKLNQPIKKVTPNNIVNLMFFTNVFIRNLNKYIIIYRKYHHMKSIILQSMAMCYNIISIVVKTRLSYETENH